MPLLEALALNLALRMWLDKNTGINQQSGESHEQSQTYPFLLED